MTPQAGIRLRGHRILIKIEVKYGRTFIQICYTQAHSLVDNVGVRKRLRTFTAFKSNSIIYDPHGQS